LDLLQKSQIPNHGPLKGIIKTPHSSSMLREVTEFSLIFLSVSVVQKGLNNHFRLLTQKSIIFTDIACMETS